MPDPLKRLATKVEGDSFFLAGLLADFAASERFDDTALAQHLGCRIEDLPRLELCRAPADAPAEFRADIADIAGHFGLDESKLMAVVRQGRVVRRQREAGDMLMAARDREEGPP